MQIAIRSNKRSLMELSEIAELTVKERLQTIENVSGVDIWGQKRYSSAYGWTRSRWQVTE